MSRCSFYHEETDYIYFLLKRELVSNFVSSLLRGRSEWTLQAPSIHNYEEYHQEESILRGVFVRECFIA
jgi:hypothetical protein